MGRYDLLTVSLFYCFAQRTHNRWKGSCFVNSYMGSAGHSTGKTVTIFRCERCNIRMLKSHDLQLFTLNVTIINLQLLLLVLQMSQYTLCWLNQILCFQVPLCTESLVKTMQGTHLFHPCWLWRKYRTQF